MTLDISLLRDSGDDGLQLVLDSEKRRGKDVAVVLETVKVDEEWRKALFDYENLRRDINSVQKSVTTKKKADSKADVADLLAESAELKTQLAEKDELASSLSAKRDALIRKIGNLVHESVPNFASEDDNVVIRSWNVENCRSAVDGSKVGQLRHHEILDKLNGVDMPRGALVAGHRAYYLKGVAVRLNMALQQYGLDFLRRRQYEEVYPPVFMKKELLAKCAELADFEETLYKIPMSKDITESPASGVTGNQHNQPSNDYFLIATSEQPLCCLHMDQSLNKSSLPRRYAGVSTCFRKEAGSHGRDMWGIFRVHQFEKVEQFILCRPEESYEHHEEMIKASEEFYQSLALPYRVVSIVSGGLNDAAAKKYDLEAWFPGYNDFRELVSCSNCTDYQARALNIKYIGPVAGEKEKKQFCHMLNGTLVATTRTLCCILENYQNEDGVVVPEVLRPYLGGQDFLPYNVCINPPLPL